MGSPASRPSARASAEERRARRATIEDPAVLLAAAAAFLAVRPRSVAETRERLRRLGYPEPLTESVLARLGELGYLDDEAFSRAWVESRDRARPRGAVALRRELGLKGVDRETIDRVIGERDARSAPGQPGEPDSPDAADLVAAVRLLERRRASLEREQDPRRRRQRAYALLARYGFDPDTIAQALASPGRRGAIHAENAPRLTLPRQGE